MYLKALEIQGFKSFPDKTVLSFGDGITAIVGPNGSGKSNISDALLWVMGEMSSKALRGGKMEDVVFGGTAIRKPSGYAEVSLVLDNTEKIFDLEENEVMVTRRYFRSGESEYYINRRSVRLKDITDLFLDTGLGREGYSIIGQGKIDEILSVKSEDRREIFEEAAGISHYRHRKNEAERKLEHTEENLVRIRDKTAELEMQVEPLKEQAEKAKKYLNLRDELKGLEISLWLRKIDEIHMENAAIEENYKISSEQQNDAQKTLDDLYQKRDELSEKLSSMSVDAERIRTEQNARTAKDKELEGEIAVLKGDIRNSEENAQRIEVEIQEQEGRVGGIREQLQKIQEAFEASTQKKAETEQEIASKEKERDAVVNSAKDIEKEIAEIQRQEEGRSATASDTKALLSALAAAAQQLYDRDENIRREIQTGKDNVAEAEKEAESDREALKKAREERDSVKNVLSGYLLRLEGRKKKADEAQQIFTKLSLEENTINSRIKMLDEMEKAYEGYTKSVRAVMNEAKRGALHGIYGPVADLISVPSQYALAIETALGGAMQYIVVQDEEAAKQAIYFLKNRDSGRGTFLPVSTIRPYELREDPSGAGGFIGIAAQLVRCDEKYKSIVSNLLGRTVIAEDLNTAVNMARAFHYRFKIVTLDGQVVNAGGSMTGGSSRNAGILSRANELISLKTQINSIQEKRKKAEQEREKLNREASSAQYETETAQGELRKAEDRILQFQERCTADENRINALQKRQEKLLGELKTLGEQMEKVDRETAEAKQKITELEGAAEANRAEEEGKSRGHEDLIRKREKIQEELGILRTSLASMEADISAKESNIKQLKALHEQMSGDNKDRQKLIEEYHAKSKKLKNEIAQKEAERENVRGEIDDWTEKLKELTVRQMNTEAERNRVDNECRTKNDELLNLQREVSVLEQKIAKSEMEEKQVLDKMWDSYELTHESALALRQEVESVPKAQKRVNEIRRDISALGNINLGAIEEYDRVNTRYTYLLSQQEDVEKAKASLEEIIQEVTEEMKKIFSEQFKMLDQSFQETFTELFGGGKADLELDDPDDILNCGIEIKVQLPGKSVKMISLLSGGEKAFVAIALYFAILKVRPTPFCVMDEIEAALDDVNIDRFASYLRRMSEKTQFIVITHRRGTMEQADILYGVTMQEQGVSKLLTIDLNEAEKQLKLK